MEFNSIHLWMENKVSDVLCEKDLFLYPFHLLIYINKDLLFFVSYTGLHKV
jgi:hypothetical protein